MTEQSRIKFNPITKEIEIEGSEKFVKTYFDKIQSMLVGMTVSSVKVSARGTARQAKTGEEKPARNARELKKAVPKTAEGKKAKRGSKMNTVLQLILDSKQGITTTELKKRTGLTDKQIWAVIYRAEKMGKIRKERRGIYIAA